MKNKKLTLAALIVAVLSLSIGFAAFSNILNIKSSASVNPSDKDFKIVFSKEQDTFVSGNEIISATGDINENTKKGSINDTGDTLYNLETEFTTPGESVEYSLYIKNIGAYNAVLNKLEIEEAELASDITQDNYYIVNNGSVKCYAKKDLSNPANEELLKSACNNIRLKVKLSQESEYITNTKEFDSYVINKGESERVTVTLEYTGDTLADTSFNVAFGSVKMNYATTKVSSSTPSVEDQICFYTSLNDDNTVSIVGYNSNCSKDVVVPDSLPLTSVTSLDTEACINGLVATGDYDSDDSQEYCKIDNDRLTFILSAYNLQNVVKYEKSNQLYSVTSIGNYAFLEKSLSSLIMPNSLISIGESAFYFNNLTEVSIPDSVTEIKEEAFNANSIKTVIIGSGIKNIESAAFGVHIEIGYGPNKIESVTINTTKDKVTLGSYVFGWISGKSDADIKWAE